MSDNDYLPNSTAEATPYQDGGNPSVVGGTKINWSLEVSKLILTPSLILLAVIGGILLLGFAQRIGWLPRHDHSDQLTTTSVSDVSWICPMMCVPPTNQPGRCPVCAMELVPSTTSTKPPSTRIEIDPRARRVAGIKTTVASRRSFQREIQVVGEIRYDERQMKTLSAYIDGRIESLKADFTGVQVSRGEVLGSLYSPDLYSAQVEYLKATEFNERSASGNPRVQQSNQRLVESSRSKLIELGMTAEQVDQLTESGTALRTLDLYAPISGTVIEKLATVGQYVKQGSPIYRLADLDKVWIIFALYPEDARSIQLGQQVAAFTDSMDARPIVGTVQFIDPNVDPQTRTVGVRVVVENLDGKLKPGEFARANLTVPLSADTPSVVVIPRSSLLSIGDVSLAYVEIAPGEFELRKLKTGPTAEGMVAVYEGVQEGENVVSQSAFMLDAQMQLQENPSLIDPDKAAPANEGMTDAEKEEIRLAMASLSKSDRSMAETQFICPVTEVPLGSMGMGTPIKLEIEGRTVFICCEGCRKRWVEAPDQYFEILDKFHQQKNLPDPTTKPVVPAQHSPTDLPQMSLPQMSLPEMSLPQMSLPNDDTPAESPQQASPEPDLPQMSLPQMKLPQMELPQK